MSEPIWFVIAYFVSAPLAAAGLVWLGWSYLERFFGGEE